MILYQCACGAEYELENEFAGKAVQCYKCHKVGVVPGTIVQSPKEVVSSASAPRKPESSSSLPAAVFQFSKITLLLKKSWEIYKKRILILVLVVMAGVILLAIFIHQGLKFGQPQIQFPQEQQSFPSQTMQTPIDPKAELGKKDAEAMEKKEQELSEKMRSESEKNSRQSAETEKKAGALQPTNQPVKSRPIKVTAITSDGTPFTGTLVENDGTFITLKASDGESIPLPISELSSINGENPQTFLKRHPIENYPNNE